MRAAALFLLAAVLLAGCGAKAPTPAPIPPEQLITTGACGVGMGVCLPLRGHDEVLGVVQVLLDATTEQQRHLLDAPDGPIAATAPVFYSALWTGLNAWFKTLLPQQLGEYYDLGMSIAIQCCGSALGLHPTQTARASP